MSRELVCCGNVHGDRICGSRVDDLKWCLLCWDYEREVRWLCKCCRRTDVRTLAYLDAGICRNCPALQRFQGGRTERKVLSDACDPDESAKMRTKAKKLRRFMTKRSFREADKCTWQAGLGRQFAGGTARGEHAPYLGQAHLAINKVASVMPPT